MVVAGIAFALLAYLGARLQWDLLTRGQLPTAKNLARWLLPAWGVGVIAWQLGAPVLNAQALSFMTARSAWRRPAWLTLVTWIAWPALIALPFFYLKQWIEFGGTLGELYTRGAWAYGRSFFTSAGMVFVYLALCLLAWRTVGELVALAATARRPLRARAIRSALEWVCRAVTFLLFPALLAVRFLL